MGLTEDVDGSIWAELAGRPGSWSASRKIGFARSFRTRAYQRPGACGRSRGRSVAGSRERRAGSTAGGCSSPFPLETTRSTPGPHPHPADRGQRRRHGPRATGFGLIGWRNGTKRLLTVRNGLPCDRMTGLVEDGERGIWLATACGLLGVTREELDGWWKDPQVQVIRKSSTFWTAGCRAGRPSRPPASPEDGCGSQTPACCRWSTRNTCLEHVAAPSSRRRGHCRSHELCPSADLRLPPLTRDLQISYTGSSMAVPRRCASDTTGWPRPRLGGSGTRRQAFYSDLGPGDYAVPRDRLQQRRV